MCVQHVVYTLESGIGSDNGGLHGVLTFFEKDQVAHLLINCIELLEHNLDTICYESDTSDEDICSLFLSDHRRLLVDQRDG